MVEFALVGPLAFLILIGAVVLSVVILHEIQLTQAVRNSARGIALCGVAAGSTSLTATLPDGTSCTNSNILTYINGQVTQVSSTLSNSATVTVYCNGLITSSGCSNGSTPTGGSGTGSGTGDGTATATCQGGYTVEVAVTYNQPLFIPLVGNLLGGGSTNTRAISAKGEATCESH